MPPETVRVRTDGTDAGRRQLQAGCLAGHSVPRDDGQHGGGGQRGRPSKIAGLVEGASLAQDPVSDEVDGDILVHFSTLRAHGRRSVPEGARLDALVADEARGFQAREILSIDLADAVVTPSRARTGEADDGRADRAALIGEPGGFEPVTVKWFNRLKGYGFLTREDG